jgi:hypothetical protein
MGRMQARLARGIRIGQAQSIRLITRREVPAQVDGEPWKLAPSDVIINLKNRVPMLQKSEKKSLGDSSRGGVRSDSPPPPVEMFAEGNEKEDEQGGRKLEGKEEVDDGKERREKERRKVERKEEKKKEKSSRIEKRSEKKEKREEKKEERREEKKEEKKEETLDIVADGARETKREEYPLSISSSLSFDDVPSDVLRDSKCLSPKGSEDTKRLLRNNASLGDVYRKSKK